MYLYCIRDNVIIVKTLMRSIFVKAFTLNLLSSAVLNAETVTVKLNLDERD